MLKTQGNEFYQLNQIHKARERYLNGIAVFRYWHPIKRVIVNEESLNYESQGQGNEVKSLTSALLRNLAACFKSEGDLKRTILLLDESIELEPYNDKAWFRRYQAIDAPKHFHSIPEAIDCLELAIKYAQTKRDEVYFHKHLQDIQMRYVKEMSEKQGLDQIISREEIIKNSPFFTDGMRATDLLRSHRSTKLWDNKEMI